MGKTRASCFQKKSQMINRHRDYISLLLHFRGYIPIQYNVCLCVCVSVCLSVCLCPHKSAIFQPIFKCDTWLDASFPWAGSYEDDLMNYTGWFEKYAPKVYMILFLCAFIYDYKILQMDKITQFKSRVKIWRWSVENSSFGGRFCKGICICWNTVWEISLAEKCWLGWVDCRKSFRR